MPQPPAAAAGPIAARAARFGVIGLSIAGVLPALTLIARPRELGQIGAVPISIALAGLLILAPASVGLITALSGLHGVRERFRTRGDHEPEQAVLRLFIVALLFVYGVAMAAIDPADEGAAACEIVAALGLAGCWAFLLLALLDPISSRLRHYAATIADAAMLSAFLHFGGGLAAPWYPLYLLATFYAAYRFGMTMLATAALANLIGFAATVALTPYWQEQGLLAGGLLVALAVLPACLATMVRAVSLSRDDSAAAQAAQTRFITVISQAVRAPLRAIIDNAGPIEAGATAARSQLSQVKNILDFAAIEAGAFVPSTEPFDLHAVINQTLAGRRAQAVGNGVALHVRVDPTMPYRLRGWPQQLAQILDHAITRAIAVGDEGAVRVSVEAVGGDAKTVSLSLAVYGGLQRADAISGPHAADAGDPAGFGLAMVRRLVARMGGRIADGDEPGRDGWFTVELPFAIDDPAVDSELDLDHCVVLIATEDSQFASDLAEPLNAWHGDPRWIDGFEGTLGFVDRLNVGACSVLIVDGRSRMLAALSFAHRALTSRVAPSFVLFVAAVGQTGNLVEVAGGELDSVLPAPLSDQLLANALHALPLWQGGSARPVVLPAALRGAEPPLDEPADPEDMSAAPANRTASPVTPITVHPRFASETPTVDPRAIAALRGLGDGEAFLDEVLDSFRADVLSLMLRITRAAATADTAGFGRDIQALRSCAANLGATRLCELLASLREVSARQLCEQGCELVQRIGDELARLDAELPDFLPERREAIR